MTLSDTPFSAALIAAARELSARVSTLTFSPPVSHVYNPLTYAWAAHEAYLRRYAASPRRVVFLGMNPGPFGMVQNGVPFGEIAAVRDWLGIEAEVRNRQWKIPGGRSKALPVHVRRSAGGACGDLFRERFGSADAFFAEHFVANYCPLAFFDARSQPDPRQAAGSRGGMPLHAACDAHLKAMVSVLQPEWVIGVGSFRRRARRQRARRNKGRERSGAAPESGEPARQPRLGGSRHPATGRALGVWE
jgi:single-strand selective monofunctional uracil DNA glycosylase